MERLSTPCGVRSTLLNVASRMFLRAHIGARGGGVPINCVLAMGLPVGLCFLFPRGRRMGEGYTTMKSRSLARNISQVYVESPAGAKDLTESNTYVKEYLAALWSS